MVNSHFLFYSLTQFASVCKTRYILPQTTQVAYIMSHDCVVTELWTFRFHALPIQKFHFHTGYTWLPQIANRNWGCHIEWCDFQWPFRSFHPVKCLATITKIAALSFTSHHVTAMQHSARGVNEFLRHHAAYFHAASQRNVTQHILCGKKFKPVILRAIFYQPAFCCH